MLLISSHTNNLINNPSPAQNTQNNHFSYLLYILLIYIIIYRLRNRVEKFNLPKDLGLLKDTDENHAQFIKTQSHELIHYVMCLTVNLSTDTHRHM